MSSILSMIRKGNIGAPRADEAVYSRITHHETMHIQARPLEQINGDLDIDWSGGADATPPFEWTWLEYFWVTRWGLLVHRQPWSHRPLAETLIEGPYRHLVTMSVFMGTEGACWGPVGNSFFATDLFGEFGQIDYEWGSEGDPPDVIGNIVSLSLWAARETFTQMNTVGTILRPMGSANTNGEIQI